MKDIRPYIQAYINNWRDINDLEDYKWEAVKYFQANFFDEGVRITARTIHALSKNVNLLDTQSYYPLRVLEDVFKEKPDVTDAMLTTLFDETKPLRERVISYMSESNKIIKIMADEGFSDWNGRENLQSFQDVHAISVYLALRYPNKHYIYKFGIFNEFAELVDYKRKSKNNIDRFLEFYSLCDVVKKELLKERDFISRYKDWMKQHRYIDDKYNLLTQDFIYAVARYLTSESYFTIAKKKTLESIEPQIIQSSDFSKIDDKEDVKFKGVKGVDYTKKDEMYRGLGLSGELWALEYEKKRLSKLGISHKVIHTSVEEGDGKGYDIESVEDDGITPRYIEVKTTTGSVSQPFFYSDKELQFSEINNEHYYTYRIHNFKSFSQQPKLLIIHGSLKDLNGHPVSYKAIVKD